jgi:hypothetical protein
VTHESVYNGSLTVLSCKCQNNHPLRLGARKYSRLSNSLSLHKATYQIISSLVLSAGLCVCQVMVSIHRREATLGSGLRNEMRHEPHN